MTFYLTIMTSCLLIFTSKVIVEFLFHSYNFEFYLIFFLIILTSLVILMSNFHIQSHNYDKWFIWIFFPHNFDFSRHNCSFFISPFGLLMSQMTFYLTMLTYFLIILTLYWIHFTSLSKFRLGGNRKIWTKLNFHFYLFVTVGMGFFII